MAEAPATPPAAPPATPSTPAAAPPITLLLGRVAAGDRAALDQVYAALYPDLKRIARARLRVQGRGANASTTMLVHESFVRLVGAQGLRLEDRRHFFAYAAKTMRNIIVDTAREHLAERRGGGAEHVTLGDAEAVAATDPKAGDDLLNISEALRELERVDPELAELVEMRYFGGYSEAEIAELQGVTERTVRRHWEKARAWLFVALREG
jgi:RNA polymerase sigma factor (TIGR02999 family)